MRRFLLVLCSAMIAACLIACGGGGQPNQQPNIPTRSEPPKTGGDVEPLKAGGEKPKLGTDTTAPGPKLQPISWTGKLGKGKLGTGMTAYDELPEPWKGQFTDAWKDELSSFEARVAKAEKLAESAKLPVAKAKEELTKFEARNKDELKAKNSVTLSIQKDRLAAIAKAEKAAAEADALVVAAQQSLATFEANDPPFFRKPFVNCNSIKDIEDQLTKIDEEKHNEEIQKAEAEAKRKRDEELDFNGLVLFRSTLRGGTRAITGTVENRSGKNFKYVQVTVGLYVGGNKVGNAIANVAGLDSGERWIFEATTFGTDYATFRVTELTGY